MDKPSRLADTIRAEMARRRIAQTLVGDRLGLSQAAVSRRLRGETPFDANELIEIAALLEVPVGSLFGEDAAA
jgi:transcriptional regulator with XRE-family HTH domain